MDRFFGLESATLKDNDISHLTTASDSVYLSIVESVLKDNDIPYLVKDRGCGAVVKVVMGFSIFGADVYVLNKDLEKASELIEQFTMASNDDEYTEEDEQ